MECDFSDFEFVNKSHPQLKKKLKMNSDIVFLQSDAWRNLYSGGLFAIAQKGRFV